VIFKVNYQTEKWYVQAIVEAMHRLTQEVSLVSYVAHELLLPAPKEEIPGMVSIQEDAHFLSIQINLINTFLYMVCYICCPKLWVFQAKLVRGYKDQWMRITKCCVVAELLCMATGMQVNYYIVVPSSDSYAELLNAPATLCGVIIGSMPLAALVSALVYSWWSNYSYQAPLIFSTLILMAGNLMYALALKFNSVWLLLIGRFLCGLGGARAINRRYISDHVPIKQLTSASAAFVSASALGMAVGPAIASLLSSVDFKFYGAPVNFVTAPGWIMTWLWGLYLVLVLLFFKEPRRSPPVVQPSVPRAASSETKLAGKLEDGSQSLMLTAPLLADSAPAQDMTDEEECEGDDSNCGDDKAVETVGELLKELTLPIRILLWIYFMLKFASEILISECSILTGYYFNWTTTQVGLFLGLLGLTVLPISAVVGNYISNIYEDRLVVLWSQIFTAVGVVAIFCFSPWLAYSPYQYIAAAILIFVSTNVLEGVNMSLLSKVMSPRLSMGVFNCGLLSTEAGTLARALADGLISVVGRGGQANLLNFTMIPTLSIVVYTTIYTWVGYYTLY
jgi:MFS family permease